MASLLSWLGNKAEDLIGGTNIQAGQRTIANANQQLQAQQPRYGVLAAPNANQRFQQAQTQGNGYNPLTTGLKAGGIALPRIINNNIIQPALNTASIPISAGRLGIANLTGNQAAANNARTNFQNDLNQNLFSGNVPFEKSLAATINQPISNIYAKREADRALRELTPVYSNLYQSKGYNPSLGVNQASLEADLAKQGFTQDQLKRAGLNQNDSKLRTAVKVGGQASQAGLNTIFDAQMGNGAVDTLLSALTKKGIEQQAEKSALGKFADYNKLAALNSVANVAGTAQQDNAKLPDYLKAGATGYATGLALPVATELGLKGIGTAVRATNLTAPSRLTKSEVSDLSNFLQSRGTNRMNDPGVYEKGLAAARKANIDPNNPNAIGDLVAAHRTFDIKRSQQVQALKDAKAKADKFSQDHGLGMSTGAINDKGERVGMNGKPLEPVPTNANGGGNMASNRVKAYADTFGIPKSQAAQELIRKSGVESNLPLTEKGVPADKNARVNAVLDKMAGAKKNLPEGPKNLGTLPDVQKVSATKQFLASKVTAIRNLGTKSSGTLADLVQKVDRTQQGLQSKYMYGMPTAQKLSKGDFAKMVDVVEGKVKSDNPTINKAAGEVSSALGKVNKDAFAQGTLIGSRQNYFPHTYDFNAIKKNPDLYDAALQHLIDTKQAGNLEQAVQLFDGIKKQNDLWPHTYGNLENARTTDIPGYNKTKQALNEYVQRSSARIAQAQHFGTENEVARKLIANIRTEGGNADTATKAVEQYLRSPDSGSGFSSRGQAAVRGVFGTARLGKAAISHVGQTANTVVEAGAKNTLKGWGQFLSNNADHKDFIAKTGVTNPQEIGGYRDQYTGIKGVASKITAPGLSPVMKMNRSVTALAGREYGNALAKAGDVAKLTDLGVTGQIGAKLTPSQEIQAARGLVKDTMFGHSRASTPINAETPTGKTVGQYRTAYAYKQTGFLYKQVLGEAAKGNLRPLGRFLAVSAPIAGATVAAKNAISGNKEGPGGIAMDAAGALGGLPGEGALQLARYGKRDFVKTAAGIVAPAAGEAVTIGEDVQKALNGKPQQLGKYGLGLIPGVGSRVASVVFPSKAPAIPNPNGNPAQKNASATAERKTLGANAGSGYSLQQTSDGKYAYTINGDTTVHSSASLKTAQQAIAKDAFGNSTDNIKTIGNTVLRKDASGNITSTTKDKFDYQVGTATLTSQKNAGDVQGWLKTANNQLQSIQKQLQDPNIDPLDAITLQNQAQALQADASKYISYGGFTKPKTSGSGSASTSFKTASSVKAPAAPKISVKAPTAFRAPSTRKLSVSKIPSSYKKKSLA